MDMFHSKLWVYQRVSRAKKNPVGSIPMKNTDIRRPTSDIGGTPTGSKEVWRVVFRTRKELEPRFRFFSELVVVFWGTHEKWWFNGV